MIEIKNEKDLGKSVDFDLVITGKGGIVLTEMISIVRKVRELLAKEVGDFRSREIILNAITKSMLDEEVADEINDEAWRRYDERQTND